MLSAIRRELLDAFFAREQRWVLTGGGALAGFYRSPRPTEDLDFFATPDLSMEDGVLALTGAVADCRATLEPVRSSPEFRRFLVTRGEERCVVDLVIDRAPRLEPAGQAVGSVHLDSQREIAANEICALLGRAEVKDLVDLKFLVDAGIDLASAVRDAATKDAGVEAATLAWVLSELSISPAARLPPGTDVTALDGFRRHLVASLQRLAFDQARR